MNVPANRGTLARGLHSSARPWNAGASSDAPEAEDNFLALAGAALLRDGKDTPRVLRLLAALIGRGLLWDVCRHVARTDAGAAAGLLLQASRIHSAALAAVPEPLAQETPPPLSAAQLDSLCESASLLAELGRMAQELDQDPRTRSRLALLWGRLAPLARLGEAYFEDADPRVRANAVESLWGRDDEEAVARFRAALHDDFPRPAANACVGLYLAGRTEALRELRNMALHADFRFRAAAAWAMGRTGDPRFLPLLAEMRAASPAPVALLRCLVQAKERILAVQKLPRLQVPLTIAEVENRGALTVRVRVASAGQPTLFRPTQWALEANGAQVWEYDAAAAATDAAGQTWTLTTETTPRHGVHRVVVTVEAGTHWGRAEWTA
ncbi:MAG: HEAT repeat domain-containing protein [Bryobacteraceae bacterium]|nr:HEAT repeat domain-containing protein [Bryobacteraceae bacterium]